MARVGKEAYFGMPHPLLQWYLLVHEDGILMSRIGALTKETPESSLGPLRTRKQARPEVCALSLSLISTSDS